MMRHCPTRRWRRWGPLTAALVAALLAGPGCKDEDKKDASGDYVDAMLRAKGRGEAVACLAQLRSLGSSLVTFADDNNGKFPPSLVELFEASQLSARLMRCPGPDRTPYVYIGGQDQSMPGSNVLVYESEAIHRGKCNVLRISGAVEAVTPDQLQADLAETREQLRE